jgi:hypothetical protein
VLVDPCPPAIEVLTLPELYARNVDAGGTSTGSLVLCELVPDTPQRCITDRQVRIGRFWRFVMPEVSLVKPRRFEVLDRGAATGVYKVLSQRRYPAKIDVQAPTKMPVRVPTNRPRYVHVLKYTTRHYTSECAATTRSPTCTLAAVYFCCLSFCFLFCDEPLPANGLDPSVFDLIFPWVRSHLALTRVGPGIGHRARDSQFFCSHGLTGRSPFASLT